MKVQLGAGAPPGHGASRAGGWRAVTRVLRSCAAAARGVRNDSVTTVFPADCRVCDGPLSTWSRTPVCEACIGRVTVQQAALCAICGEALGMESARFATAMGAETCTMCRLAPPDFSRAVAYASYEDELREMLHLLKYERILQLAKSPLGHWLADAILVLAPAAASDITVVAVPLFAARERERSFNQSAVLANAAISHLKKLKPGWTLRIAHDALLRTRDTEAQFSLQPAARRRNLRGAFRVADPAAIRDREILLVDDIMTTGATARECARVLLRAGAAKIWVATLARAQAEGMSASGTGSIAVWDATYKTQAATGFAQPG